MIARTRRGIAPCDAAVSELRDRVERRMTDGTDGSGPRPEEESR